MDQDPIDLPALRKICMGQEELARKLLGQLLIQAPGWREVLNQAAAAGDGEQVRFVCHTICGAAAALQARRLEQAAAALGTSIRTNNCPDLQAALGETLDAIAEAQTFTNNYLN